MENHMDFDQVIDRRHTNCAKWDEMDEKYRRSDLIHLGVADMDFKAPLEIRKSLQKVLDHGIFGYTNESELFFTSIQRWIKKQLKEEIPREWIVFCPRINISAGITVEALTNKQDKIIIHTPSYTPLKNAITKNNRCALESPLKLVGGRFVMDFEKLEREVDDQTKMLVLCSPHNPTCRVWTKEEMQELEAFCIKHDLYLLSDEIHSDLLKKDVVFTSALNLSEELKERLIYVSSMTKTFNIPGIIVSYMVIPNAKIRAGIEASIDRTGMHNPNIFSVAAVETGYSKCDNWLEAVNTYIDNNEIFLRNYMREFMPKFHVFEREGTCLLWIAYGELGLDEKTMERWFIEEANTAVYMGSTFGPMGEGFYRLNLGTSRLLLEKALDRMHLAYAKLLNQ